MKRSAKTSEDYFDRQHKSSKYFGRKEFQQHLYASKKTFQKESAPRSLEGFEKHHRHESDGSLKAARTLFSLKPECESSQTALWNLLNTG